MSNTLPKWTPERTEQLTSLVADLVQPIAASDIDGLASDLETTSRSVSSKLRKMDIEVASVRKGSVFSSDQSAALSDLVTNNPNTFTYAELAETFEGGEFTAKQVQGKVLHLKLTDNINPTVSSASVFSEADSNELRTFVEANAGSYTYAEIAAAVLSGKFDSRQVQGKLLSMKLTASVKATPKQEAAKKYTDEEEATLISMSNAGECLEDIAVALDKAVKSVRGKALSLLNKGTLTSVPAQRDSHAKAKGDILANIDISGMTVTEIAEAVGRTEVGIKALLTRRKLVCVDHDGATKAAKIADKKEVTPN